jgi:hypothetical protein
MYATVNREKAPVITIAFTGQKATAATFAAYLKELEENYASKSDIALVFDARKALDLNPIYQLKQAQWMAQHKALIKRYCKGIAYVIPHAFLRNVLGLIFKIQPNPVPFKVFETMEEGEAWAVDQISGLHHASQN